MEFVNRFSRLCKHCEKCRDRHRVVVKNGREVKKMEERRTEAQRRYRRKYGNSSLDRTLKELDEYNKKNRTLLSYGKYCALREQGLLKK